MVRVVEAPTPTDVKGKTEEILLTIVGEDIILPPKKSSTEPIGLLNPNAPQRRRADSEESAPFFMRRSSAQSEKYCSLIESTTEVIPFQTAEIP